MAVDSVALQLRQHYETAFARLVAVIPDSAQEPDIWPLWALARFKRQQVRWAGLRGRGYFAIEPGTTDGGWLAIVPPDNELLPTVSGLFDLDPSPTLHVLMIRPENVSEPWAAVFLVNGLSHLADRVLGVTPPNDTGRAQLLSQFRGYELELLAADRLAGGRLRESLDALLDKGHFGSIAQLVAYAPSIALANRTYLESLLPGGAPMSHQESVTRAGFLTMALLVRFGQRIDLDINEVLAAIDQVNRAYPR